MNKVKLYILFILIIIAIVGMITSNKKEKNIEKTVEEPQTKIALYFTNPKEEILVKEYRFVNLSEVKEDMAGTIIKELLKGPNNKELVSKIPSSTNVREINIEPNKIVIDFSKEFMEENEDDISKLHKIYSVVNSLTEIAEINIVEIHVEGNLYAEKGRL